MTLEKQKSRRISGNESTNVSVMKPAIKMCVFGTCLENLTRSSSTTSVPFVVSRLCCYIEKYGTFQQNLNEGNEETSEVTYLKKEFDESGDASLELRGNVSAAMKLLKLFLEELPEPLIPLAMHTAFFNVKKSLFSGDCVERLKSLVSHLPVSAFCVLKYLSHFLLHMARREQSNGLNAVNLSTIFGPIIFRPDKEDPMQWIMIRNITHCFVVDYYAIFEKQINSSFRNIVQEQNSYKRRQMMLIPSSVVPVPSMMPLSVEIPHVYSAYDIRGKLNIQDDCSILSVENESMDNDAVLKNIKITEENMPKDIKLAAVPLARKRKEALLASDSVLSQNVAPCILKLLHLGKNEIYRKDYITSGSHENSCVKNPLKFNEALSENVSHPFANEDYGGNQSPHPPDPKRRELEFFDTKKVHVDEKYRTHHRNFIKYYNDTKVCSSKRSCRKKNAFEKSHILSESSLHTDEHMPLKSVTNELNNNCSIPSSNINDCINSSDSTICEMTRLSSCSLRNEEFKSLKCLANEVNNNYSAPSKSINDSDNDICEITRPASCPVPDIHEDHSLETNQPSLSHSWSTLFEAEEPIVSNRYFDWNNSKNSDEAQAVSPLIHYFRSAEREFNVTPSPLVEEHFHQNSFKDASVPMKQRMKKISELKKKLKHFDEKYEAEHGYKPSQAEKTKYPEAQKLLNKLHKARKELQELKDEVQLASTATGNLLPCRNAHILEDATNSLKFGEYDEWDSFRKSKLSIQKSWDNALKCLDDDRKLANRPDLIEDMTADQVKDEKLAIQKTLLHFESVHGKPSKKDDRNTIRPLYERYRNIKRLLVKSNSFPVTNPKLTINSLEPIMEHEMMDFRASVEEAKSDEHEQDKSSDAINQNIGNDIKLDPPCFEFLDNKYNNSSLHELPLTELIFHQNQARIVKRRLRKVLREFEAEFMRTKGRKIQKEDKVPVENLYEEYKFVKARLRLLEALISKHHNEHASD